MNVLWMALLMLLVLHLLVDLVLQPDLTALLLGLLTRLVILVHRLLLPGQ